MKKMNKKGFTLMEMLIVIAIIAILIAIAIPTFTNALEKSKQKTDMANARSLKSLVVSEFMLAAQGDTDITVSAAGTYYLDPDGQTVTTSNTDCVLITASKWDDCDQDDPISITIDASGLVTGAVPAAILADAGE